jgi:DNA-binding GntR family transcriptional regulator
VTEVGRGRARSEAEGAWSRARDRRGEVLRDHIIWGTNSPGTVLSVRKVAEQWHVRLMPVREALRYLTVDELVDVAPGSATRVKQISLPHVREICGMRSLLEPVAARCAGPYLRAADIAHLRAWLRGMEQVTEMDRPAEWHRSNEHFHAPIFRKGGTTLLERMAREMWERIFRHFTACAIVAPGFRVRRGAEHRRIIRAIEAGSPRATEEAWRAHTTRSGIETLEYLPHVHPTAEGPVAGRQSGVTARAVI